MADKLQLLIRAGVNSEVKTKAEKALLTDLQFVAHFFGVLDSRFFAWIAHPALFGVNLDSGLYLGNFFAQVIQYHLAINRLDNHGQVNNFIEVDHARQPAGVNLPRIAINVISAGKAGADSKVVTVKLQRAA